MNTGGKYDSKAFKKSVGLNGVGTKAVNALSDYFRVRSFRDGKMKVAEFLKETSPKTILKPILQTETEPKFLSFLITVFSRILNSEKSISKECFAITLI